MERQDETQFTTKIDGFLEYMQQQLEETMRKMERQDETQFTTKIDGFLEHMQPATRGDHEENGKTG